MIQIRETNCDDADSIRNIHLSAFPEGEGERIARLAVDLLMEETSPSTLSLVAEADGKVVGHVAFSPLAMEDGMGLAGHILAPLAVAPEHQNSGIGSQLVTDGLRCLCERDAGIVLVYGDPDYYGRFGFRAEFGKQYVPPYELKYPFGWLGMMMNDRQPEASPVEIRCVPALRDPALW